MVHSASASASYLSKVPTYIPPLDLRSEFPAYQPSTSQVSRSMSNRLVYADDPWNSAKMAHGAVERGKMKATTSTASMAVLPRPRGPRLRPISQPPVLVSVQPLNVVPRPKPVPAVQLTTLPPPQSTSLPYPSANSGPSHQSPAARPQQSRSSRPLINVETYVPPMEFVSARKVSLNEEETSPPPRASPYNIPYAFLANITSNTLKNPHSKSASSSREPSPARNPHPSFLVPGARRESRDSKHPTATNGAAPRSPLQEEGTSSTIMSSQRRSQSIPKVIPPVILPGIWSTPDLKSPGSQTGSALSEWEEVASPKRTGARSHVLRKVSESTQDAAGIAHVRSVHLKTSSLNSSASGAEEEQIYTEPAAYQVSLDVHQIDDWEEEDKQLGTATKAAVDALRRQLEEDEEDEEQWSSITDLLLQRLASRSSTADSI